MHTREVVHFPLGDVSSKPTRRNMHDGLPIITFCGEIFMNQSPYFFSRIICAINLRKVKNANLRRCVSRERFLLAWKKVKPKENEDVICKAYSATGMGASLLRIPTLAKVSFSAVVLH